MKMLKVLLVAVAASAVAWSSHNPYGVHLFLQDAGSRENFETHLAWARALISCGGWAKAFFYGITADTPGAREDWCLFIQLARERGFVPIVRLGGVLGPSGWIKPDAGARGDYAEVAAAFARVIGSLPRSRGEELWVEVWNEPNLKLEWSGTPNPDEYAAFYIAVADALRALGDGGIRVVNGALSPGGDYNSIEFAERLGRHPGFVERLDGWATHTYPAVPPEVNIHSGTADGTLGFIDSYVPELEALAKSRPEAADLPVLITECGFTIGQGGGAWPKIDEIVQADYMMRAFRDWWSRWPEVIAVTPYAFSFPFEPDAPTSWVHPESQTAPDGTPRRARLQYRYVSMLAKPCEETGTISGKVTDAETGLPVEGATLTCADLTWSTAADGNYFFPHLAPGRYALVMEHPWYEGVCADLLVRAGENTVLDLPVEARARTVLEGRVLVRESGEPVAGARVTASPSGAFAVTDEEGRFVLRDLPPGPKVVSVAKTGYIAPPGERIVAPPGETDIVLYAAPGEMPEGIVVGDGAFEETDAEGRPLGWEAEGGTLPAVTDADSYTGSSSLPVRAGSPPVVKWSGYTASLAGSSYTARAFVKPLGLDGRAYLRLRAFLNDSVTEICPAAVSEPASGTGVWRELRATITPPRTGRVKVELVVEGREGGALFDDVAVWRRDWGKEMLFGFVPVIGESVGVEGFVHDDRGAPPEVLGRLYASSRATCIAVGGTEWRFALKEDPGEAEPVYDWRLLDAAVDPFLVEGKVPIALVGIDPPEFLLDEVGSERFWRLAEHFFEALVRRLNGKGVYTFIFGNEYNLLARRDWPALYVDHLSRFWRVAKRVNPDNCIIGGNLSDHARLQWEMLYEAGFKDYCDVVGYHPYTDDPGTGIDTEDIADLHEVMVAHGDGGKRIFLGEGWGPKRRLKDLERESPDDPPSKAEVDMLRAFVVNGYRNLTTRHGRYDPSWVLGAFFFTMNDNTGGEHWAERAVEHRDKEGNVYYTVDGYWMGPELPPPAFFNGGLVEMSGREKDLLLAGFPDGRVPGHATVAISCDGAYELYVDGRYVGGRGGTAWQVNEVYLVPLDPGEHVVAVRANAVDGWPSGLIFDLRWGGEAVHSGLYGWKVFVGEEQPGWRELGFDDSGWARPEGGEARWGDEPWTWGYAGFVDSPATWIWPRWGESIEEDVFFRRTFRLPASGG